MASHTSTMKASFLSRPTADSHQISETALTELLRKHMLEVLRRHYARLNKTLKGKISDVAKEMFSRGLLTESVRDEPEYDKIIREFEAGLGLAKSISDMQEKCKKFLESLYSQRGTVEEHGQQLADEWKKEAQKLNIAMSFNTVAGEAVIDEPDMGLEEMIPTPVPNPPAAVPDPPAVPTKDNPPEPKYTIFNEKLVKNVNIIIMTVTKKEHKAVMANIKPDSSRGYDTVIETAVDNITIYLGMYGQCEVAILRTRQGRDAGDKLRVVQQAVKAQYVISVGIGYGLNERKAGLGCVVVSDKVVDISKDRVGEDKTGYDSQDREVGKCLLDIFDKHSFFTELEADKKINVESGNIVSRPTLLENHEVRSGIQEKFQYALAGEMEAYGIMHVAHEEQKFEAIVIKAVADWGMPPKEAYKKWQPFAAYAAAEYVLFHLNRESAVHRLQKSMPKENATETADLLIFD